MRLILLLLFPILLICPSCKEYKPAEPTFFLTPSDIRINVTPQQGTSSHRVTDLFMYVNGQFQGCYPVEGRLPIISHNQSARVQILAGIRNNGISETRIPWPFYNLLQFDTLLESGTNFSRALNFSYTSATTFTWIESFDSNLGISMQKSDFSDTTFRIAAPSESFEGRSIELGLGSSGLIGQIESSGEGFALPRFAPAVYLELNYKGSTGFEVGLIGDDKSRRPALHINAQQNWNKIYIQLGEAVSKDPASSKFRVYFRIENTAGITEPRIFLDNIKLVYLT